MKKMMIYDMLEHLGTHFVRKYGIEPMRPDIMRFAECLIIMCATLAGYNTEPVLYASGSLFKRTITSAGTDHSSFAFPPSFSNLLPSKVYL